MRISDWSSDVCSSDLDRAAAELAHRHVERHAGAGRVFFKDHRQRIAGERGVGIGRAIRLGAAMLLPAERVFQYRRYGVAAGVREIKKPPRHAPSLASYAPAAVDRSEEPPSAPQSLMPTS